MARESTIKLEFMLEQAQDALRMVLATPGITKSTTTGAPTKVHATESDDLSIGEGVTIDKTGWPSLDGKLHIVTSIDGAGMFFTIATDTFAETAALAAFGMIDVFASTWAHACLVDFTPNPGTPGEVDATTMCDTERVTLPGLSSPGTATFNGAFDLDDPGMLAFQQAQLDAIPRYLIATTRRGQVAIFHGVVSSFSIGALTVEGLVTFTGTMTLDAAPTYQKGAVE